MKSQIRSLIIRRNVCELRLKMFLSLVFNINKLSLCGNRLIFSVKITMYHKYLYSMHVLGTFIFVICYSTYVIAEGKFPLLKVVSPLFLYTSMLQHTYGSSTTEVAHVWGMTFFRIREPAKEGAATEQDGGDRHQLLSLINDVGERRVEGLYRQPSLEHGKGRETAPSLWPKAAGKTGENGKNSILQWRNTWLLTSLSRDILVLP